MHYAPTYVATLHLPLYATQERARPMDSRRKDAAASGSTPSIPPAGTVRATRTSRFTFTPRATAAPLQSPTFPRPILTGSATSPLASYRAHCTLDQVHIRVGTAGLDHLSKWASPEPPGWSSKRDLA